MPLPPQKDIYIGIGFVLAGTVKVVFDRWQVELVVQGYPTRKPHKFDHHFLLWFIKQLMQFGLLFLWMAIDKNWMGCARFRHGDVNQRGDEDQANLHVVEILDGGAQDANGADDQNAEDNPENGNDGAYDEGEGEGEINRHHAINDDPHDDEHRDDNEGEEDEEEEEENNEEEDRARLIPQQQQILRPRPRRQKKYTKLLYLPPSLFDVASVLLIYFGKQLTYSSSFGMLKGTEAFFTAVLSMAFLAQHLPVYIWFGVVVAALGFGTLGISDYVHDTPEGFEKYGIAAGDLQIVMGQIMFATKLIYEEKFIRKHSIHPMKFLGSEASYGLTFATILLLIFNLVSGVQYTEMPNGNIEDMVDAAWQFAADWRVMVSVIGSLLTYIIYTYLGLFLVRDQGALPRIMVEMLIWAKYWGICLLLHWENFFIAQVPGFLVVLIGILIYSHILVIPFINCSKNDEMLGPEPELPMDGGEVQNDDEDDDGDDDDSLLDGAHNDGNGRAVDEGNYEHNPDAFDEPLIVDHH